jgi:cell fate regulator YaaT (PSP1 superfamily)
LHAAQPLGRERLVPGPRAPVDCVAACHPTGPLAPNLAPAVPKYVIRYGVMRKLGVFATRGRDLYARGQRVIARTPRGQEAGEVLCEATEHVLSQMEADHATGQIVRLLTADDDNDIRRLDTQRRGELDVVRKRIEELKLDMQLVEVERVYGGERVVVYYLSEDRVDFRELVKVLAHDLQTRVEMRQIGVRDEAKLLADYGDCGKPVCCNTHLSEMPPVSMKMAKLQKATLDPTKISGRCGRLKCCLRYEYDTYQVLQRELPRIGASVVTGDGRARVLSQEILSGDLMVETEDGRRIVINARDVLTVIQDAPKGGEPKVSGAESPSESPGVVPPVDRSAGRPPRREHPGGGRSGTGPGDRAGRSRDPRDPSGPSPARGPGDGPPDGGQ